MSSASNALASGLTTLLAQLGKAFTYGGTSFKALSEPNERKDDYQRGYDAGEQWDTQLVIDPTVAAFSGGIPSKGEVLTQTSNSRKFSVVGVSYDDYDHVAMLQVRKLG